METNIKQILDFFDIYFDFEDYSYSNVNHLRKLEHYYNTRNDNYKECFEICLRIPKDLIINNEDVFMSLTKTEFKGNILNKMNLFCSKQKLNRIKLFYLLIHNTEDNQLKKKLLKLKEWLSQDHNIELLELTFGR